MPDLDRRVPSKGIVFLFLLHYSYSRNRGFLGGLDLDSQNISLILQRYFNLYIVPIISDSRGVNLSIWLQISVSVLQSIPHPHSVLTPRVDVVPPPHST